MSVYRLLYVLYKIKILTPIGLFRLVTAIFKHGINVMALLQFAAKTYGEKIAVVDEKESLSYSQLLLKSEMLANVLVERYQLTSGQKIGIMCKNNLSLISAIFAVSRLGADIYLLNTEMSPNQFNAICNKHEFALLIHDPELTPIFKKQKLVSYHEHLPAINNLHPSVYQKLTRTSMSKLILLTGGTTGESKSVAHRPSLFHYVHPFIGFITKLKLLDYRTAYIATPIYHGYGIAVLFLFLALGKKIVITKRFTPQTACHLIREHEVDIVTVVPLMVHKMLKHKHEDLKSLTCIASGGAELNPKLVGEVFETLGPVLYNLYGTSEAGTNIIATPEDLAYSAKTIGRKINGVHIQLLDYNRKPVADGLIGQICIKNTWSMTNKETSWIETGDIGYRDSNGYYFLCGRIDDMVVSAGVNVYPIELEQVIIHHPNVEDAAVVGMKDEEFGQRLKAFITVKKEATITKEEIIQWLRPRVAKYQLPKEIVFIKEMPYTSVGKVDKKKLKKM